MPDLIRHPVPTWIPAFAGMTILRYLIAGVISRKEVYILRGIGVHGLSKEIFFALPVRDIHQRAV
jgi:hypothetical protein